MARRRRAKAIRGRRRSFVQPVSKQFLDELDAARKGQGHAQPGASAEKVIEAALDLLLAPQAKRRAEVKQPRIHPRPSSPGPVTAAVKRAVWSRDDGKCSWPLDSGGTCGSTLRLEIDHVVPRGRGDASTVDGCGVLCAIHNQLAARQLYGDDWMDRFTDGTIRNVPVAREPSAPWGQHPPRPPLRPILVSRRRRHSQQCLRRGAEDRASPSAACLGAIQPRTPSPEDQHCGEG